MRDRMRIKPSQLLTALRQVRELLTHLLSGHFLQGAPFLPSEAFFRNDAIHEDVMRLGKRRVDLAQLKADPDAKRPRFERGQGAIYVSPTVSEAVSRAAKTDKRYEQQVGVHLLRAHGVRNPQGTFCHGNAGRPQPKQERFGAVYNNGQRRPYAALSQAPEQGTRVVLALIGPTKADRKTLVPGQPMKQQQAYCQAPIASIHYGRGHTPGNKLFAHTFAPSGNLRRNRNRSLFEARHH